MVTTQGEGTLRITTPTFTDQQYARLTDDLSRLAHMLERHEDYDDPRMAAIVRHVQAYVTSLRCERGTGLITASMERGAC